MLSDHELDYRFGWRWLLPIKTGDLVLLLGFDELELAFWKRTLVGVEVTEIQSEATVWVVKDLLPDSAVGIECTKLHSLCVVGSGKTVSAWRKWVDNCFADISHYGMLPSDKPRLVLPIGKSNRAIEGLALHRPGRWLARCAVFTLKFLVRFGIDRPLRAKMVFVANKDHYILPNGAQQDGFDSSGTAVPQSFALYLGTPDEYRKTVIMPLGASRPTILKHGELSKAKTAIRNEAKVLATMNETALASQIPLLYDVVEKDGCVALHQEYRPRKYRSNSDLAQFSVDFLVELSRQGRSVRLLKDVLADLGFMAGSEVRETGRTADARVRARLDTLARRGAKVWGHRSHGDFAPWNYAWTAKGFFVFDWEESKPWEIAFGDVFYRILGPAIHVARSSQSALVQSKAIALAIYVGEKAELPIEDIRMYWGLWLLQRIRLKTEPLYEQLLENLAISWK